MNNISFPKLGLDLSINPVAFSIGGMHIYWYGIIIAAAFLLAVWYCLKKAPEFGLKSDDVIDMLIFAVPLSIIGARAYYVLFMFDKIYYYDIPAIFRIWDGGLAIYGAVIVGTITVALFCKFRRIRVGTMLDLAAFGLLIGQCIGRWGNFVNAEAYGSETTSFLGMTIYNSSLGAYQTVHPTFLYESLLTLAGFLLLHFTWKKLRKYSGQVFLMYTAWYGLGRGIIEGLRQDSLYAFGSSLRVSQLVGFLACIVSLALIVYMFLFKDRDPELLATPYLPKKEKKRRDEDEEELTEDADVEDTADDAAEADDNQTGGTGIAETAEQEADGGDDFDDDFDDAPQQEAAPESEEDAK